MPREHPLVQRFMLVGAIIIKSFKTINKPGQGNFFIINNQKLNLAEQDEAERLGLEEFKFATNEEMLVVMGLV